MPDNSLFPTGTPVFDKLSNNWIELKFDVSQRENVELLLQGLGLGYNPDLTKASIDFWSGLVHLTVKGFISQTIILLKGYGYCFYTETGERGDI